MWATSVVATGVLAYALLACLAVTALLTVSLVGLLGAASHSTK